MKANIVYSEGTQVIGVYGNDMMLAMPSKFPQRIFGELDNALPWMATTMRGEARFEANGLAGAVREARAALRATG